MSIWHHDTVTLHRYVCVVVLWCRIETGVCCIYRKRVFSQGLPCWGEFHRHGHFEWSSRKCIPPQKWLHSIVMPGAKLRITCKHEKDVTDTSNLWLTIYFKCLKQWILPIPWNYPLCKTSYIHPYQLLLKEGNVHSTPFACKIPAICLACLCAWGWVQILKHKTSLESSSSPNDTIHILMIF